MFYNTDKDLYWMGCIEGISTAMGKLGKVTGRTRSEHFCVFQGYRCLRNVLSAMSGDW